MKILVMNGPNLNMLGKRDANHYGNFTLADVEAMLQQTASALGVKVSFFQSNHEGALIDEIQVASQQFAGIVFNPGAYTHYSYAIRDAIEACGIPVVEVHISDILQREEFRKISVIQPVCVGQITGLGIGSYTEGFKILVAKIESEAIENG
ncbi:MAG: type II 3-dehydroquinate dehydratase [Clostridia bacterium]